MAGRLTGGSWRWAGIAAVAAFPAGCGGGEPTGETGDTEVVQQCADPVFFDLTITGDVTAGGAPAAGIPIRIEERTFGDGTTVHGESTSGADGTWSIAATELPIVDGCLAWAMGYFVVADDGTRTAEWPINSVISGAWSRGDATADVSGVPLDLGE